MTLDSIKIAFLDSTEALFSASKNWDGLLALWEIDLRSSDDPELLAELVQRMVRICRDTGRDERSAQIITFGEQRLAGQRGHLPVATRDLAAETDSGEYVRRLAGQSARSAPSSPPTASASRADLSASPTTHSRPAAPPAHHAAPPPPPLPSNSRGPAQRRSTGQRARRPIRGRDGSARGEEAQAGASANTVGRSAHLEASGRAELHGDWAAVATAEEALVALAESPQERVHHLVKLAAVQSKQLADLDAAVALYHDVLALEPAHPHALDALEELHTYREEWVELIDILERRIAAAKSDGRRVQWLLTIAELTERLGDVEGALEVYRRVLAIDPKHAQARDAVKLLDELR